MDHINLQEAATQAIEKFQSQAVIDQTDQSLKSIVAQLRFIQDCASRGLNPVEQLEPGKTFTYGIISSREFASPGEMELKAYLNLVDKALYPKLDLVNAITEQ